MSKELLEKLRADLDASKELAPVHRADAGIEAIYNFIVAVTGGPAQEGSEPVSGADSGVVSANVPVVDQSKADTGNQPDQPKEGAQT